MATTRRQAANDGAKRGMNMTLDKMQNSPVPDPESVLANGSRVPTYRSDNP